MMDVKVCYYNLDDRSVGHQNRIIIEKSVIRRWRLCLHTCLLMSTETQPKGTGKKRKYFCIYKCKETRPRNHFGMYYYTTVFL